MAPLKVEQYVVERLEQMIDITKEIEDEKAEYRMVTAYLNDIHTIEELPEEVRKQIDETATNIVQLDSARNGFLNSAKKLTDAQFSQLAREEKEIPDAIRRLASNEAYQDMLCKDMKYLEREKSRFQLHKEYLTSQQHTLRRLLYVLMGLTVAAVIVCPAGSLKSQYVLWICDHAVCGSGQHLCHIIKDQQEQHRDPCVGAQHQSCDHIAQQGKIQVCQHHKCDRLCL